MQEADRLAGDAVGIDASQAVPDSGVGGEERRDVGQIGGALEGAGDRFDVGGFQARPLQLVQLVVRVEVALVLGPCSSSSSRARASAKPGRRPELPSGPSLPRSPSTAAATAPRRWAELRLGREAIPPAAATMAKSPSKLTTLAPRIAPFPLSSRWKA